MSARVVQALAVLGLAAGGLAAGGLCALVLGDLAAPVTVVVAVGAVWSAWRRRGAEIEEVSS